MIIDNKGKLFGKVSIVDIMIVLVVLAAIAGVAYKVTRNDSITPFAKLDTIQTELYFEEMTDFAAESLKVGAIVKEQSMGATLGKVIAVYSAPSISYGVANDGSIVQTTKPGYSSVRIVIEGNGKYGENGVYFDNAAYYINSSYAFFVGNTKLWGQISDFRMKE